MNQEEQLKITTNENETSLTPPPPQNLNIRTMESDLKSLQETGGQTVKPYNPNSTPKDQSQEQIFELPQTENSLNLSNLTPPPPADNTNAAKNSELNPNNKKKNKIFSIIIIALVIIAAIAVGYFIIYPIIASKNTTETPTPQQPIQPITNESIPITEPVEQLPEQQPLTQLPSALNLKTIEIHASYFKSPADFTREINLIYADLNSLKEIIGFRTNETPILEEIIIKNEQNKIISFSGLMPLFAPNFFKLDTLNYFEDDYTLYTYINNQGTWLGVIAKLKNNADIITIQNQMINLQNDPDNRNFFLTDPGLMKIWRDGKIKDKPSSIVDFEKEGASLSYTWFDKYLLLSTNLNGATEAATRLGF